MSPRFAVVAFAAVFLGGCARPGEREAEKAIRRLLPSYLGKASSYAVHVRGKSLGAIQRGRLREVHLLGKDVRLTEDLVVRELTVDAREVVADLKSNSLRGIAETTFQAKIELASLRAMAKRRRLRLTDLALSFRGRELEVTLRPEVFGYPTVPITVLGSLVPINGGRALDFEPNRGRLSLVPIPEAILDFVADRLNPVVDLSSVTVPIRIETANIESGALVLSGSIPPDEVARWRPRPR